MFTAAEHAAMIQATGGVAVVDVSAAEDTYGHFEQVSMEVAEGDYAAVITTKPSVVVPDGIFSEIGPRKGVDRAITVDGDAWVVADIVPGDSDGGLLRLILAEA